MREGNRLRSQVNTLYAVRCTAVPLYRCTAVPLYRCTAVPLYAVPLYAVRCTLYAVRCTLKVEEMTRARAKSDHELVNLRINLEEAKNENTTVLQVR